MQRPLRILFVSELFRQFQLILPVIFLVYESRGLTAGDFFLLQGIFSLFIFFLEIPTGYIGDVYSRRNVLILSGLFYLLAYVLLFFSNGFFMVLCVELLWAISVVDGYRDDCRHASIDESGHDIHD